MGRKILRGWWSPRFVWCTAGILAVIRHVLTADVFMTNPEIHILKVMVRNLSSQLNLTEPPSVQEYMQNA